MNKKLAIIKDGIVVNSIVWDDENNFIADEGYTAVFEEQAGPGWLYENGVFSQPQESAEEQQV